jgi:hypothetical protein
MNISQSNKYWRYFISFYKIYIMNYCVNNLKKIDLYLYLQIIYYSIFNINNLQYLILINNN